MLNTLEIEVCFPEENVQHRVFLNLPEGATVGDALKESQIFESLGLDFSTHKVGVFSKLVKMDTPLKNFDRVEIYRPLLADPKEVRKRRAQQGKGMKKGVAEEK